ncbi:hypothetical protein IAT38_002534 [Cryptococcus sp. DSM 104549]
MAPAPRDHSHHAPAHHPYQRPRDPRRPLWSPPPDELSWPSAESTFVYSHSEVMQSRPPTHGGSGGPPSRPLIPYVLYSAPRTSSSYAPRNANALIPDMRRPALEGSGGKPSHLPTPPELYGSQRSESSSLSGSANAHPDTRMPAHKGSGGNPSLPLTPPELYGTERTDNSFRGDIDAHIAPEGAPPHINPIHPFFGTPTWFGPIAPRLPTPPLPLMPDLPTECPPMLSSAERARLGYLPLGRLLYWLSTGFLHENSLEGWYSPQTIQEYGTGAYLVTYWVTKMRMPTPFRVHPATAALLCRLWV